MPFDSGAMPFFQVPCPFSERKYKALHFGKNVIKIGQNLRKL